MKISIKTLQGKPTELEVSETDTLADIKQKIATQMGVEVSSQKLIHYGKIMVEESKKLADYGVKDKDFLVLMITKVHRFWANPIESPTQGRAPCAQAARGPSGSRSQAIPCCCSAGSKATRGRQARSPCSCPSHRSAYGCASRASGSGPQKT